MRIAKPTLDSRASRPFQSVRTRNLPPFIPPVVFLFVIFTLTLFVSASALAAFPDELVVTVYPNGYVMVDAYYKPESSPGNLTVPLIGEPAYYGAEQSGLVLPAERSGNVLSVTYYTDDVVHVYYLATNITSKTGAYWLLEYESPLPTVLLLPDQTVPVDVQPANVTPAVFNGTPAIILPPGHVRVEYIILPQPSTSTPGSPPQQPGGATSESSTRPGGVPGWVPWVVLGIALAGAATAFVARRRSGRGGSKGGSGSAGSVELATARLDERDEAILEYLRSHGAATAQDIMDATGIPRTPLYRRLRKLESMGLIEHVDEPGSPRLYRLREPRP